MGAEIDAPHVALNGIAVSGAVIDYEVDTQGAASPARFSLRLATAALPSERGLDWMAGQGTLQVEIRRGSGRAPLILGEADRLGLAPFEGVATLVGRDLSGRLADAPARSVHKNRTAAEIMREIAEGRGLSCVIAGGDVLSGLLYQADHARLSLERSEWDLVSELARANGLEAWVEGAVLNIAPPFSTAAGGATIISPRPEAGVITPLAITLERDQRLSGPVSFEVVSFHSRTAQASRWVATASGSASTNPGATRRLAASATGLDVDQTRRRAEDLIAEIMRNELRLSASFDPTAAIDPRGRLRLVGFGPPFDRTYQPARLAWRWSSTNGGLIELEARTAFAP